MSRCCALPVAASLHGEEVVAALVDALRPTLAAADITLIADAGAADPAAPLVIVVLTGGTEQLILDALAVRRRAVGDEPVLLVTHPDHNSLPAALELLARVQLDGGSGTIVPVRPGERSRALADAVDDLVARAALHRARIGSVGVPSDWLVASVPDAAALRTAWGIELVDVPLAPLLDAYERATTAPLAVPIRLGARHERDAPPLDEVRLAARFEPVLQACVDAHRLDAVAVRCFDLVLDAHTSGCLALAALNDRGVIAGCEGDVASTVALLWTRRLLGEVGWMANPAVADPTTGVIELAHCTVPLSMVSSYELRTHFESGLGVGIEGALAPGPVTLLRLGGRALERLWCVDGTALATTPRPERCRTQLDVRVEPSAVAELLTHPLGNHVVVVRGHHAERLRRWHASMR